MFVKQPAATVGLLFALSLTLTQRMHASTITVVPSEAQPQIQASINNSHIGDTISFQAGTYNLLLLKLQPGRSYIGATNGQSIIHGSGGRAVMQFYGSDLTVQHLIFDGGGLYLGGPVSGAMIEYNTFRNISFGRNGQQEFIDWTATVAIFIDTSLSNSDISHNKFLHLNPEILRISSDESFGVSGILGYGLSNTTIEHNTFDTVNEGIHLFFDNTDGEHVRINSNTFTNVHRVAIEMQDGHDSGVEVAYNKISKPLAPWKVTFGISAAVGGTDTSIHDNIVDDQLESVCGPKCWVGIGIEAFGVGTKVFHNTVSGFWITGVAVGISTNLEVEDNALCGPEMANNNYWISNETGYSHAGEVFVNNTKSTDTTCARSGS